MIWGPRIKAACEQAKANARPVRYSFTTDDGEEFVVTVRLKKVQERQALEFATHLSTASGVASQS